MQRVRQIPIWRTDISAHVVTPFGAARNVRLYRKNPPCESSHREDSLFDEAPRIRSALFSLVQMDLKGFDPLVRHVLVEVQGGMDAVQRPVAGGVLLLQIVQIKLQGQEEHIMLGA